MQELDLNKLLNREPANIDLEQVSNLIKGKRILCTGAAGSIGSELVRQIAKFNPEAIIFFDHNENNQFFLEKEIKSNYPNLKIIPRIGSITDRERAKAIFEETKPNIVYHLAANKHVPLGEENPSQTIATNILGTHVIADMAAYMKCEAFILISTDKTVKPTSVYGASKRIAEYYIQVMAKSKPETKFITVRFGNVLGSAGSVIPIFKAQIEAGGPLSITHPEMFRYFMTIPEASQLLLQSAVIGNGGEIFVLDMGEPIKIIDLAKKMIILSGLTPDVDIKINFTGLRPGEKLYEELTLESEKLIETSHPKIRSTKTPLPSQETIERINDLFYFKADAPASFLRKKLSDILPEANLKKD